jgi:hypothetical protein
MTTLQKVFLAIAVTLAILADIFFKGWGRSVLLTAVVFGGMIPIWQKLWKYRWFWATLVVLTALQVAVLFRYASLRQLLERSDPFMVFVLGLANFCAVSAVMYLVGRWFNISSEELQKAAE